MDDIENLKPTNGACAFCKRSQIICDGGSPCDRCLMKDVGHLCRSKPDSTEAVNIAEPELFGNDKNGSGLVATEPTFASQNFSAEFSSLNDFLNILEDPVSSKYYSMGSGVGDLNSIDGPLSHLKTGTQTDLAKETDDGITTPKEHFFLTAADPATEISPEEKLRLVINAKLQAGLLKPYNYATGYKRLQNYMDRYMNQSSKQRILKPLSTIRPAFRAIAGSLKDVDLVMVEESFERMLLSYDRVFTSMSIPACLWRRTGEIYRANKEFASLVDYTVDELRDGKLAIYELLTEESAVNFWEKYGSIAFDKGQKAVLTSCNLRVGDGTRNRPCCFSFTIRRDKYNIPICIIGNFIPIT